ncbi:hypothetical protein ACN38_g13041 [Penicillium nordicum]|uniref:Uncharacterized protein n=1 Tax=Penicillium nordicum TaxID=229535 RepID=A0A0M9W9C6_9EURO|nr:hypothetical protein ACN38_g13041 [Penicillium nordicum]
MNRAGLYYCYQPGLKIEKSTFKRNIKYREGKEKKGNLQAGPLMLWGGSRNLCKRTSMAEPTDKSKGGVNWQNPF